MTFRIFAFAVVLTGEGWGQGLYSFESGEDLAALRPGNARAEVCETGVTEGEKALCVDFQPAAWPQVLFRPAVPFDFREAGELAVDITNPGAEPVTFRIRVDDDLRANGTLYGRTAAGTVEPGTTQTFAFRFDSAAGMAWGMRGLPSHPGTVTMTEAASSWRLELSHIVQFQIFLSSPPEAVRLVVDNIRLRPPVSLDGIADRFGQFSGAEWPGKVGAEEELVERLTAERAEPEERGAPGERDRFGGWLEGPRMGATGFFRAEKVEDKWWLVTPEGTLFFSMGPTGVRTGDTTFTTGRENMFQWLPGEGDPLRRHVSWVTGAVQGPIREGRAMNFYGANLERRYGPDFFAGWAETALERLSAWGFNTIANWSDDRLFGRGVPYVVPGGIGGTHGRIPTGNGNTIHDVFDARFAGSVRNSLRAQADRHRDDPFCLGWFVDNELSWGTNTAVAAGALSAGMRGSAAFGAMLGLLRERYADVGQLNAAWGTGFASFGAVGAPPAMNERVRADYAAFARLHARTYFRTVRDELRGLDPNHLYLGARFAGLASSEVAEACAEFCDVMSYNIYQRRVEAGRWEFLKGYDKPVMIGEFHFGALDRGMLHTGLGPTASQEERAAAYGEYVRSALLHPSFVGAHWFQWVDQPLTGRTRDGENYNIGLVSIVDEPYRELLESARGVHGEAYWLRWLGEP